MNLVGPIVAGFFLQAYRIQQLEQVLTCLADVGQPF
jgi:hypothetical protein